MRTYLAWVLLSCSIAIGCGDEKTPAAESQPAGAAARSETEPQQAVTSAASQESSLPPRGAGSLTSVAGRVTVSAFVAPRQPLLEKLAQDEQFRLELSGGPLPPLTLQIQDVPLELAVPLLVGDLKYEAVWASREGVHRLELLRVDSGPAEVAASSPSGLRPGEVSASLDRALDEWKKAEAPLARSQIESGLASSDPEARVRAALALESEGQDLETLRNLLETDPDPRVRAAATAGLEDSEEFGGVDALLGGLDDPDPEVVVEVLDSLEFAGDATIVPRIQPLLAHSDVRVREAAAEAIDWLAEDDDDE